MMMKKALFTIALATAFSAAHAADGNAAAGKEKSTTCAACHGPDGNSQSPDFPKLAGQQQDYLEAALLADTLLIATWIVACDGRLRCTRRFDILRMADGKRVLDAEIDYFCLNLDTGRPCRFPREFVECYTVNPDVAAAYAALPEALRHVGQA